jgi:hypothetical protein
LPLSKSKKIYIPLITLAFLIQPFLYILLATHLSTFQKSKEITPTNTFCIEGYFFLPKYYIVESTIPSEISFNKDIKIFDKYRIFSKEICLQPTEILVESSTYTLSLSYIPNTSLFNKEIQLTTKEYPQMEEIKFEESVNIGDTLEYELTYEPTLLDYYLTTSEQKIKCRKENSIVKCDLSQLTLSYESSYKVNLISMHKDIEIETLNTMIVRTLSAIKIESSNIPDGGIFQTLNIQDLQFTFNKEIEDNFETLLEDENGNSIEHTKTLTEKILKISPSYEFKQNGKYTLKILNLKGIDGSRPESEEYVISFSIDDGPTVKSTNIGSPFSVSNNILLTFNQNIDKGQDIKRYIKLNSGIDYSFTITGNKVSINPTGNLGYCQSNRVEIFQGLKSTEGLIASQGNTYTFKTNCARVSAVGTSVQGRSIYATYFGTGSKKILFFGSMHGSEANTKNTLSKLISDLETNSARIPSDKTIIVITTLNPDGVANRTRFNANGVDLNRNFNASDWVSGTYFQSNFYPTGGGIIPFSEPETIAIKNLVMRENPYLTISYHSAAAYVVPSSTSKSVELGQLYSQLSGYKYIAPGTEGAFTYDITGTFEGWAGESGYNAIVIELASAYNDEFSKNRSAMWKMIEY